MHIFNKIKRVRPPRSNIHIGGELIYTMDPPEIRLTFTLGVVGDFTGRPRTGNEEQEVHRGLLVDRDNIDDVMKTLRPSIRFSVANEIRDGGGSIDINLSFFDLNGFAPERVVQQVPELSKKVSRNAAFNRQLTLIMNAPELRRLQESWQRLRYLVFDTETGVFVQIRLIQETKSDLFDDMRKHTDVRKSCIFQRILGREVRAPFGVMISDYEFSETHDDIWLLDKMSTVAELARCPFITSVTPSFHSAADGIEENVHQKHGEVGEPSSEQWNLIRKARSAKFLAVTVPVRVKSQSTNFVAADSNGHLRKNPAYVVGARIASEFAKHDWCLSIVDVETSQFVEVDELGRIPVLFQSEFDLGSVSGERSCFVDDASSSVPCVIGVSRFMQYLIFIAQSELSVGRSHLECELVLNQWINRYVSCAHQPNSIESILSHPLSSARVEIRKSDDPSYIANLDVELRLSQLELKTPFLAACGVPPKL